MKDTIIENKQSDVQHGRCSFVVFLFFRAHSKRHSFQLAAFEILIVLPWIAPVVSQAVHFYLPGREMHMGYHLKRHHCNIGWLGRTLSCYRNMAMVLAEHVELVVVEGCTSYGLVVGLGRELGNKFPIQRYIPANKRNSRYLN